MQQFQTSNEAVASLMAALKDSVSPRNWSLLMAASSAAWVFTASTYGCNFFIVAVAFRTDEFGYEVQHRAGVFL
jgi:hypothetical protein